MKREPTDPQDYQNGDAPSGAYLGTGRNRSYWVRILNQGVES